MGKAPGNDRELGAWMSNEELLQRVQHGMTAPQLDCDAVWGISANGPEHGDLSEGAAIAWKPTPGAQAWAADVLSGPNPPGPSAGGFQGGAFVTLGDTPSEPWLRRAGHPITNEFARSRSRGAVGLAHSL